MSVPLRKRKSSNNGSVSLPSPSKRRKLYVEMTRLTPRKTTNNICIPVENTPPTSSKCSRLRSHSVDSLPGLPTKAFLPRSRESAKRRHTTPSTSKASHAYSRSRSYSLDSHPDVASAPRERSYSIDSLPPAKVSKAPSLEDSTEDTDIETSAPEDKPSRKGRPLGRRFDVPPNAVEETSDIDIPGEYDSDSESQGLPIRIIDDFTFFDFDGNMMEFMDVANRLTKTKRRSGIRCSGVASRCLDEDETGDSDIADEEPPVVILQELSDFWADYETENIDGIWGSRTISIATDHAWYILEKPSTSYLPFFRRFWIAHHISWNAISMVREEDDISFDNFTQVLKRDIEAKRILGQRLTAEDCERDFVCNYISAELASFSSRKDSNYLASRPLLQHFMKRAQSHGTTRKPRKNGSKSSQKSIKHIQKTITMPLVQELTKGLFLQAHLKAGLELTPAEKQNRLIQVAPVPDIMHPDHPTNIDWGKPVKGTPGYYRSIRLDDEKYRVGDVIMVQPGEDAVEDRALNAQQQSSRARDNELGDTVWFCQIIYLYKKQIVKKTGGITDTSMAHVRWYLHGSKTILQETAHPYGLFALAECDDIDLSCIMGRCNVRHLEPGDEEPFEYHCGHMWDAAESRFVDIPSKLKEPPSGRPVCQACKLRDERKVIEENEVVPYDKTHISLRNLHYHQHDFVYIAAESQRPYLIGQVDRFIIPKNPQSPDDCEVRVKILGRYDDIAETLYGAEVGKDERRLYLTDEMKTFPLPQVEGKCFIREKEYLLHKDIDDHFYVDLISEKLSVQKSKDLRPFEEEMDFCEICVEAAWRQRKTVRSYQRSNKPLRGMELFAGAGGLSVGLEQSEFVKMHWAVELDTRAAATFQANHPNATVFNADTNNCLESVIDARKRVPIKSVKPGKHFMPPKGQVDFIAGGFPCQSFSGLNHQRHSNAQDPRTPLVTNMMSYVEFYRPRFVLMENVKGLLQHHTQFSEDDDEQQSIKMSVAKFIFRALLRLGYQVQMKILQAADYGSPQRRERIIFWGALRSEILPEYPLPTHVDPCKKAHVLRLPTFGTLKPALRSNAACAPFRALVVADAISDLPKFDWKRPGVHSRASSSSPTKKMLRKTSGSLERNAVLDRDAGGTLVGFLKPVEYAREPQTRYQAMMRHQRTNVTLHCSRRFTEAVVERVWYVTGPGVEGPHDIPRDVWPPRLLRAVNKPQLLNSIWNKQFLRLKWDRPFDTALTKCQPFTKGGKVLHPTQSRIITARECARSQGFPDTYEFKMSEKDDTPNHWMSLLMDIYKQIGNAVPVPLANALGKSLGKSLVSKWEQDQKELEDYGMQRD